MPMFGDFLTFELDEEKAHAVARNQYLFEAPEDFEVTPEDMLLALRGFADDAELYPLVARSEEVCYTVALDQIFGDGCDDGGCDCGCDHEHGEECDHEHGHEHEDGCECGCGHDHEHGEGCDCHHDLDGNDEPIDLTDDKDIAELDDAQMTYGIFLMLINRNLCEDSTYEGNSDITLEGMIKALESYLDAHGRLGAFNAEREAQRERAMAAAAELEE